MTTHRLVIQEDLNQYGKLFGGRMLSWVDEASFIAASLDYPDAEFVTMGMDEVVFKQTVEAGSILSLICTKKRPGRTSVTYNVKVIKGREESKHTLTFETNVTFVNIDKHGRKALLPVSDA